MKLKSHLLMDIKKRSGILLLILLILTGLLIYFLVDFKKPIHFDKELVASFQAEIDSLKSAKKEVKKPDIYPFNPNFITDYKGYTLGMSPEEIDRLHSFRESGEWINSEKDFKEVTKVSDSLLVTISPYFKFPEWVTNPEPKKSKYSTSNRKTFKQKKALNSAIFDDFKEIMGMTDDYATKIINYRKRLGGFVEDNQLFDVYGVPNTLVYSIKEEYTVKQKPTIKKLDVNTATASDLSTLPYISFNLAMGIIDYRTLHEGIKDVDELKKIDGITPYKFNRIKLYLSANQD
ncbi:MAG: helix-hairpin-helix domain-containing protein [Leeuwenhoekiella sp.]